jgi:hypothetical protein
MSTGESGGHLRKGCSRIAVTVSKQVTLRDNVGNDCSHRHPASKLVASVELYMKGPLAMESATASIDQKIKELGDWRGKMLAKLRILIHEADPDIIEEWKWAKATSPGVPVWSHDGIVCTGESYKQAVKLTFARGASIEDPKRLFNSSLEGNARRAIDLHDGDKINEAAFRQLIRAAVAANSSARAQREGKKK